MNGSVKLPEAPTRGLLSYVEGVLFRHRRLVLASLAVFTLIMGWFAVQLRMDAGFEKQLPVGHEYIETFEAYRNDLLGANRLTIVVKAREGDIWSAPGLKRLYDVTQAVTFLPGVSRSSVRSLWTPNAFVNEITEEGFRADPLVPGTVSPEHLDDRIIAKIANSTAQGGFIGTLVSRDQSSAMITVELNEYDSQGAHLDYVTFNHRLEKEIRQRFEDGDFEIQIIGFAKQIGDIADGASAVLEFCLLALLLTAGAVYWYCHSLRFTLLALVCSLASLVWQFGSLRLLGYGLDPLAVLVPFLVFAIGVSHGVQQINFIVREIAIGKSAEEAARSSFTGLLVPGTLALVTALVSFVTLLLIPIPMVRELAITASLGVAYKIVTNLVMLPLMASLLRVDDKYAAAQEVSRQRRSRWLRGLARLAEPRKAQWVLGAAWRCSWRRSGKAMTASSARCRRVRRSCARTRASIATRSPSPATTTLAWTGSAWCSKSTRLLPRWPARMLPWASTRIVSCGQCRGCPASSRSRPFPPPCVSSTRATTKATRRWRRCPSTR